MEDFARLYDGNDNPIGRIYTTREFKVLFSKFNIDRVEVHYFSTAVLAERIANGSNAPFHGRSVDPADDLAALSKGDAEMNSAAYVAIVIIGVLSALSPNIS